MQYAFVEWKATGEKVYTELTAKTDFGARRQAAKLLNAVPKEKGTSYYVAWFRLSDHCQGTLDI